jgi:NADH dehydrogenase (ubiquinone) Fe-S protein 4
MATTLWRLCGRSLVAYLRCRGRTISTVTALTEVERRGEVQDVPAKDSRAVGSLSGLPEEHLRRTVRIYSPARNAMQSGTHAIQHWRLDFDVQQRWENPTMGWASSADPLSNVHIQFNTMEEAIDYAERHGSNIAILHCTQCYIGCH